MTGFERNLGVIRIEAYGEKETYFERSVQQGRQEEKEAVFFKNKGADRLFFPERCSPRLALRRVGRRAVSATVESEFRSLCRPSNLERGWDPL